MKHKCDISVGRRMFEELCRLFPNKTNAEVCRILGCDRKSCLYWSKGETPSPIWLQRLHYLGGDVIYVLTGKRYALVDAMVLRGGRMRWNGNRFEEES